MPTSSLRCNLGDWQNLPVVQDQVIKYMESMAQPLFLREIYRPLGLPRFTVNRVLGRLHARGVVTRYKMPMVFHRYDRRACRLVPAGAMRQSFLYAFSEACVA